MTRQARVLPGSETMVPKVVEGTAPGRDMRAILVRVSSGLAAAAMLLIAARSPIWRAEFSAPQYPQGLGISAYGDRVDGDLGEIRELSHYIGMPPIDFAGMPEMRLWLPVICIAILAALVAVLTRRRWLRRLACAGLWLIPVGALADVQFRLWQTGHGLDPMSALRVPPFTPRVLGPTGVMNFTLWAYPGLALVLIAAAAALVSSAPALARRLSRQ